MAQGIKADISEETLSNLLKTNTIKEIAKILNVSEVTIKRYKAKYSLKTNLNIAKQRNSEKHTLYKCNKNYQYSKYYSIYCKSFKTSFF